MRQKRVYILSRKILKNNTRIFKQAKSLTDTGYDVTIIGIQPAGLAQEESRDGYTIIRLNLDPLHNRLLRFIRQAPIVFERATLREARGIDNRIMLKPIRERWLAAKLLALTKEYLGEEINNKRALLRWLRVPMQVIYRSIRLVLLMVERMLYFSIRLVKKTNFLLYRSVRYFLLFFRWPFVSIDYYYRAYLCITRKLPQPDIIHANDLDTLLVATILAWRFQTELIYDAQEFYTGLHTLPKWYRKWLSIQEYFLIRKADRITVVNDAIGEAMERRYKIKIDEVILNCPPYEDNFLQGDARIRKKFNIKEEIPVYLYSGGLVKQRGIENTILALKHLEKGVLFILGEGQLKDKLVELIKREGLEDRVFFSEFIPHAEVPKFISSADVGLLPYENVGLNHYLCSPSKLFHYIMAELPVACSDFPFLRKVILDNGLGATFDPADPKSIAEAIEFIVGNKTRYQEIKENLSEAKKRYCWENEEKKFLRVYGVLNNSSSRK